MYADPILGNVIEHVAAEMAAGKTVYIGTRLKVAGITSFSYSNCKEQRTVRRNSEFGNSGGFEFPDHRASVLYWNEWHKRRLRLRVR